MRPNLSRNNKKKIFNDPVYGFISIPNEIIFDIIQHPFFQRLRRIKQLGLTHLVYPGALHTRFHHALGAMHLMYTALQVIKRKGTQISEEEEVAVLCAILLHDIGHGPFSHSLEHDMVNGVSHESISSFFIEALVEEFPILKVSLEIFNNRHPKPFLYQLVSSQLDMDRLDYLNRDSFYTGVSEGVIGSERIIEMLTVRDNQLLLEEKAIYSVEKFIVARRLMYWQVYLHKTAVSAEFMLIHVVRRAKELIADGHTLFASPALQFFLSNKVQLNDFKTNPDVLLQFSELDDFDIMGAIKVWQKHSDKILSELATRLVNRNLLKIEISKAPYSNERREIELQKVMKEANLSKDQAEYFVYSEKLINSAYNQGKQNINLLMKNGDILDLSIASDNLNISALANPVEKYCLCYPG
ncbi:MAG: HD domain-containing protein [Bacteroidetes bacterium]|nr:HD domain-containing protein [Bacteroidota bacterium]